MKRILREPLLHFLLFGAAIFVAYGVVTESGSDEPGTIVITQGQVTAMAVGFNRTWQRPPTDEELEGLIRERVQEEVYVREAKALGLDSDDTVIRRRLRQKVEFISDDAAAQVDPTDEQLHVYLKEHIDTFRTEPQFTFRQVYLNPKLHGENLARDTGELLARLKETEANANNSAQGDPLMLEHKFEAVPSSEIANRFGESFAAKLSDLKPGQWQGPIDSGYGVHLVFVAERTKEHAPALDEVREVVQREWANAQRVEANKKFYQSLLQRYIVTIERPQALQVRR